MALTPTTSHGSSSSGLGALLFDSEVTGVDATEIDTGAGLFATTYKVLVFDLFARTDEVFGGTTLSTLDVIFNADTGANYNREFLQAANAVVAGSPVLAGNALQVNTAGAGTTASVFGVYRYTFPNYGGTVGFKSGTLYGGVPASTAAQAMVQTMTLAWLSTSAISRIKVSPNTSGKKLKVGSRLTVFGF